MINRPEGSVLGWAQPTKTLVRFEKYMDNGYVEVLYLYMILISLFQKIYYKLYVITKLQHFVLHLLYIDF